jgi:DNA polymerase II small subunit
MRQEAVSKRKEAIGFFLKNNILVSSDVIAHLDEKELETTLSLIKEKAKSKGFLILNRDVRRLFKKTTNLDINWLDLEKSRVLLEKGKNKKVYNRFIDYLSSPETEEKPIKLEEIPSYKNETGVKVVFSYQEESKKRDIQDFVQYFNMRYKAIEKILMQRPDLKNIMSISRIVQKKDRETVSLIGIVKEKQTTKNNNLMLTLEDPTGFIKVLVNKTKPKLFESAKSMVLDEVIAVKGVNGQNIVFANDVYWPDIPHRELKKSPDEAYALVLSDLHVGSNNFLPDDFGRLIGWLNGSLGNERQQEIAKKIKYIFVVGDLVDGCGIYPEQDSELSIKDIYQQYEECARLLKQIPSYISIIICPGNHDAMRMAEPQLPIYEDFSKPLYDIPNVIMVSNPAVINIHGSADFSGFDVLLYHGYSFDYFVANVDSIRNNGGYDRGDLIMRFLLQRRHLAPTHTSSLYIPETKKDPLVIDPVPDMFITGHIHKSIAANYRNVTMISGSCWQSKTAFQEKVGHKPEPSRAPLVNLQTREVKILKFGK